MRYDEQHMKQEAREGDKPNKTKNKIGDFMNKDLAIVKHESEEQLHALTEEVNKVDAEVDTALREATANFAAEGGVFTPQAEQQLALQVQAVLEVGMQVLQAQETAVGDAIQSFQMLVNRLKDMSQLIANAAVGVERISKGSDYSK